MFIEIFEGYKKDPKKLLMMKKSKTRGTGIDVNKQYIDKANARKEDVSGRAFGKQAIKKYEKSKLPKDFLKYGKSLGLKTDDFRDFDSPEENVYYAYFMLEFQNDQNKTLSITFFAGSDQPDILSSWDAEEAYFYLDGKADNWDKIFSKKDIKTVYKMLDEFAMGEGYYNE